MHFEKCIKELEDFREAAMSTNRSLQVLKRSLPMVDAEGSHPLMKRSRLAEDGISNALTKYPLRSRKSASY